MKFTSPIRLSLIIALSTIIIITLIYSLFATLKLIPFNLAVISITVFFLFLFIYFLSRLILEKFIFEKIKLIYKIIQSLKLSKSEKKAWRADLGEDMIGQVSKDVMEWAQKKTAEIEQLQNAAVYRREFLANVSHEI